MRYWPIRGTYHQGAGGTDADAAASGGDAESLGLGLDGSPLVVGAASSGEPLSGGVVVPGGCDGFTGGKLDTGGIGAGLSMGSGVGCGASGAGGTDTAALLLAVIDAVVIGAADGGRVATLLIGGVAEGAVVLTGGSPARNGGVDAEACCGPVAALLGSSLGCPPISTRRTVTPIVTIALTS
ncbi:MAG TPA: hypothetical protein VLA88_01440 [Candidatus Saccharimonadales bacterium]|nr:hypothetical protein [Candidatus Saccharimonadales bacterium]